MAKQDFLPSADRDLLIWGGNFGTQLAALGPSLGLTAAEITEVVSVIAGLNTVFGELTTANAAAKAKTAEKQATFLAGIAALRVIAARLKRHPAYTTSIGQQFGVIGPENTTDLSTRKPTLKATAVMAGSVTLGFNKSTSSGVRIESQRGAETAFSFQAIDTSSPYVDTRPNLTAGPETRQYRAIYLDRDNLVGEYSNTITVTVPG
ncbi:MAG: hypothetical protein AABP62_24820 [Planctomycetota bacterium]